MIPEILEQILKDEERKEEIFKEANNVEQVADNDFKCDVTTTYYESEKVSCKCSRNSKCQKEKYCPCFKAKELCSPRCHM